MIQKCDGVKILDLEEKLEVTGSEYIVTAEKDNNYKLPLESVADIVIGNSKFKAAIKDVYESSTPTASVSLDKDKFLFSLVYLQVEQEMQVRTVKMVKMVKMVRTVLMVYQVQMEILLEQ